MLRNRHTTGRPHAAAAAAAAAALLLLASVGCSWHQHAAHPDNSTPPVFQPPPSAAVETAAAQIPAEYPLTGAISSIAPVAHHDHTGCAPQESSCLSPYRSVYREGTSKLWTDYCHYYDGPNIRNLLLGVAAGSLLANTSLDHDYHDWYQQDVRSNSTDDLSRLCKPLGRGDLVIPAFAGLALIGAACDDTRFGRVTGDLGLRTTRAYLVGAPPMLFLQSALGGSRPLESEHESRWDPFQDDNGVSGHSFIGAVPFITAAKMAERPLVKGGLYFLSTLPAWSRVNDDAHYLSQACLGWWMAYLACNAVDRTEYQDAHLTFTPVTSAEMVGLGVIYER